MAAATPTRSYADLNGGIEPTSYIFEDDQCVVIEENLYRQAPVHFIVAPKKLIPTLMDASLEDEKLLGHLLLVARRVAIDHGGLEETGFRVVINEGPHSCQTVEQLHVHVLGGRQMGWPFA